MRLPSMATEVTERRRRQHGTLRGVGLAMLVLLWWRDWSLAHTHNGKPGCLASSMSAHLCADSHRPPPPPQAVVNSGKGQQIQIGCVLSKTIS